MAAGATHDARSVDGIDEIEIISATHRGEGAVEPVEAVEEHVRDLQEVRDLTAIVQHWKTAVERSAAIHQSLRFAVPQKDESSRAAADNLTAVIESVHGIDLLVVCRVEVRRAEVMPERRTQRAACVS